DVCSSDLRRREELLLLEILAAKDAVEVHDGDLDLLVARLREVLQDCITIGHVVTLRRPVARRNQIPFGVPIFDRTVAGGPWNRLRTKVNQASPRSATAPPTM